MTGSVATFVLSQVTFLYELKDGACPKSYGTACARLAGMPEAILAKAEHLAAQLDSFCLTDSDSKAIKQSSGTQQLDANAGIMKELSKYLGSSSEPDALTDLRNLQAKVASAIG